MRLICFLNVPLSTFSVKCYVSIPPVKDKSCALSLNGLFSYGSQNHSHCVKPDDSMSDKIRLRGLQFRNTK